MTHSAGLLGFPDGPGGYDSLALDVVLTLRLRERAQPKRTGWSGRPIGQPARIIVSDRAGST